MCDCDRTSIVNELRAKVGSQKCITESSYIFICYSRADSETVYTDVLKFRELGYNIWIDENNLDRTKDNYTESTFPAIESITCELVLFYISKKSLVSNPIYEELLHTKCDETKECHGGNSVPIIMIDVDDSVYDKKRAKAEIYESLLEQRGRIPADELNEKSKALTKIFKDIIPAGNGRTVLRNKNYKGRYTTPDQYYNDILKDFSECCKRPQENIEASLLSENRIELVKNEVPVQDGDKCIEINIDDTFDGKETVYYPFSNMKVSGSFMNNLPHGFCKTVSGNGDVFYGQFVNGIREGKGSYYYSNGDIYEGEYKNGKENGKGKKSCPGGYQYIGDFKDGYYWGYGTELYADGGVFEGVFVKGKRHGHGKETFPNGVFYEGEYIDDCINGQGKLQFPDGYVYERYFKDGKCIKFSKDVKLFPRMVLSAAFWLLLYPLFFIIADNYVNGIKVGGCLFVFYLLVDMIEYLFFKLLKGKLVEKYGGLRSRRILLTVDFIIIVLMSLLFELLLFPFVSIFLINTTQFLLLINLVIVLPLSIVHWMGGRLTYRTYDDYVDIEEELLHIKDIQWVHTDNEYYEDWYEEAWYKDAWDSLELRLRHRSIMDKKNVIRESIDMNILDANEEKVDNYIKDNP